MATQVYISKETRDYLGEKLTREMTRWAEQQGMKQLLVVSQEDALAGTKTPPKDLTDKQQLKLFQNFAAKHPGFPFKKFDPNDLSGMAENAVLGKGQAMGIRRSGDGPNDTAIIVIPSRFTTKEEQASYASGVPASEFKNLPGTNRDWAAFVIAHEIGHTDQPKLGDGRRLVWEAQAEQDAVGFCKEGYERGALTTPHVPTVYNSLRALRSFGFKNDDYSHDISAAVRTLSEGPAPVGDKDLAFAEPLHAARSKVAREIGTPLMTDQVRQKMLHNILFQEGSYRHDEELKALPLKPADAQALQQMSEGKLSYKEGLKKLDPALRQYVEKAYVSETQILGIRAAQDNPKLMHATTDRLYRAGAFDDNAIGKQYAYEYLNAARTYVPDYFGVDLKRDAVKPPVFPETQLRTPTSVPSVPQKTSSLGGQGAMLADVMQDPAIVALYTTKEPVSEPVAAPRPSPANPALTIPAFKA